MLSEIKVLEEKDKTEFSHLLKNSSAANWITPLKFSQTMYIYLENLDR